MARILKKEVEWDAPKCALSRKNMISLRSLLLVLTLGVSTLSFADVASVTFNNLAKIGGGTKEVTIGTVTLTAPAGVGGVTVNLSDDSGGKIDLDVIAIHIAEGASTGTFHVTSDTIVATDLPVNVTANDGGASASGVITLRPFHVNSMIVVGAAIRGCAVTVNISLNGKPRHTQTVTLSAPTGFTFVGGNNLTFLTGKSKMTLTMLVGTSAAATGNVLTATFDANGYVFERSPLATTALIVKTFTADSTTLTGGTSTMGHLTLNGTPTSDAVVTLAGSAHLSVPASVTVTGGSSIANFSISSSALTATRKEPVKATISGKTKSLSFTINP